MDDILVLAPNCWKIKKAVKVVNGMLGSLGLEMHPRIKGSMGLPSDFDGKECGF